MANAREEVAQATAALERLHTELQTALIPKDPDDARNAFLQDPTCPTATPAAA